MPCGGRRRDHRGPVQPGPGRAAPGRLPAADPRLRRPGPLGTARRRLGAARRVAPPRRPWVSGVRRVRTRGRRFARRKGRRKTSELAPAGLGRAWALNRSRPSLPAATAPLGGWGEGCGDTCGPGRARTARGWEEAAGASRMPGPRALLGLLATAVTAITASMTVTASTACMAVACDQACSAGRPPWRPLSRQRSYPGRRRIRQPRPGSVGPGHYWRTTSAAGALQVNVMTDPSICPAMPRHRYPF